MTAFTIRGVERRKHKALGMTPLIDVIFLLVVFYLLVSRFAEFQTLPLSVVSPGGGAEGDVWSLLVTSDGKVALDGKSVPVENLTALLTSERSGKPGAVLLRVGDAVPVQLTITALDAIRRAGLSAVSVARERGTP